MAAFNPIDGCPVLPLILEHTSVTKTGTGTELQSIGQSGIVIVDLNLGESRGT